MNARLAALMVSPQTGASLQPDTVGIQVALWGKDMDNSCFCAYFLLCWVESESE
jgi:hypothetical protein